MNLCLLHCQADALPLSHQRSLGDSTIKRKNNLLNHWSEPMSLHLFIQHANPYLILEESSNNTITVSCLVAQSCLTLCDPTDCSPPGYSVHGDSPGNNTGVGCHALLQGISPNQGSNPGLPHCKQILYCLSHQGSCPGSHRSRKGKTFLSTSLQPGVSRVN